MKEFKGTKGPWEVVDEHPSRAVLDIHGAGGDAYISVYTVDELADHNANLIAAAPDLLEALMDVSRGCVDMESVRKAIAKALGETK